MLKRLLGLIADAGGSTNQAQLARKLGTSEALVTAMIGDLVRMGYLANAGAGCHDGACSGCETHKGCGDCAPRSIAHLWTLTPTGRSAARNTA
jgi:hypothetical protein